jgi:hypothetical protein
MSELLDPVSVLLHLATLPLEENGSRIAIHHHHIIIQSDNYLQTAVRKYNGYTREDISKLFDPVLQTYYWFFNNNTKDIWSEFGKSHEFRELIRYCVSGLKALQTTYQSGNVVFTLQIYINMYNSMLNDCFDLTYIPDILLKEWKHRSGLVKEEEIKKIWSLDTLKQLQQMLNDCFNTNAQEDLGTDDRKSLLTSKLEAVKKVIDRHDGVFHDMIKRTIG